MTVEPGKSANGQSELKGSNQGTSIGFIILTILIVFVAYWMYSQGRAALQPSTSPLVDESVFSEDLEGFNSDLFYLSDEALLGFVEVYDGPFTMGSDPALDRQAYENEQWSETQRQGSVDLPRFYINRFEVTVAQYRSFIQATGHPAVEQSLSAPLDHPVTNITWTDALAYCRWLERSLMDTTSAPELIRNLLVQGWHISLPTEAQWEKAARSSDGRIYPWGTNLEEDRANYGSNGTMPVGSYDCPDCSYGLSDMSGNVWELTRSPYQSYPFSMEDDRNNLSEDALWVMRGGSFNDAAANIRTAIRGGVDPGVRNNTIGFRLVLTEN